MYKRQTQYHGAGNGGAEDEREEEDKDEDAGDGEDEDDAEGKGDELPISSIDAYWLQRECGRYFNDPLVAQKMAADVLETLTEAEERDCENRLVILLDYDKFFDRFDHDFFRALFDYLHFSLLLAFFSPRCTRTPKGA